MACEVVGGPFKITGGRDAEGYREYKVWWKVRGARDDGPYNVMNAAGLYLPGAAYSFGADTDARAYCLPTLTVTPASEPGPPGENQIRLWGVEQTFTTRPQDRRDGRCGDADPSDPLLKPQSVSGGFSSDKEEATHDRFGHELKNSAHEAMKGPAVEFDTARATVRVEQNVMVLGIEDFYPMVNTVNAYPLWGFRHRCIKLMNVSWKREMVGACQKYYTRTFDFEVKLRKFKDADGNWVTVSGWDRDVLDEGNKVLNGHWGTTEKDGADNAGKWVVDAPVRVLGVDVVKADPRNPAHFRRAVDRAGNPTTVILNGGGVPYDPTPPPTTTGCPSCVTTPAPRVWVLYGRSGSEPVDLTYDDFCTWKGTSGTTAYEFRKQGNYWGVYTNDGPPWLILNENFTCNGVNALIASDPSAVPGWMVVRPKAASRPGNVHVEKYDESDFLTLGIPTVFWD